MTPGEIFSDLILDCSQNLSSSAGVGGGEQHGGGSQTAAAASPGTDAPGKHGKQWYFVAFFVNALT